MDKEFVKSFFIFIKVFLIFTFLYLFLFFTPLFSSQKVLFYRGIFLLFTLFVFSLIFIIFKFKKNFLFYFSALVFVLSFNLSFFVLFPVTFERSLTMYLLNTLKNESGIKKTDLEKKLVNEYILNNHALEKRLFEQQTTGFVITKYNRVYLTKKGFLFLKFSQVVKKIFNIH